MPDRKVKILIVVNVDWFFLSHRLPIAKAAVEAGFQVTVAAADTGEGATISKHGFQFIDAPFLEEKRSLPGELGTIYRLNKIYRECLPDLVHHVTIRPVLYGSIAARLAGVPAVVNALSGLGYVYINDTPKNIVLRKIINRLFRFGFSHQNTRLILQNMDDMDLVTGKKLIDPGKISLIRGSGVDVNRYKPSKKKRDEVCVALIGRMLWDKGVNEFIEAAEILLKEKLNVSFHLYGAPYISNPMSIPEKQLMVWNNRAGITYHGNIDNIHDELHKIDIVCLPSYREGLPKALIEAASAGKPIVTTDAPGCRDVVQDGKNGFLVPVKNVEILADRIKDLVHSPALREKFGNYGREKVIKEFSEELIVSQTINLYGDLLSKQL